VVNFSPGAKIKPASGVTVGLSLGYFAGDYQQVFDLSAGGSITVLKTAAGYVTPPQFGAAADGVADDTVEFKMAISAIGAPTRPGTGTVFVPKGTYKLSEALLINDRMTLYGETGTGYGRPLSVLIWPANCCGIVCHHYNTTSDNLGYNHALKTPVGSSDGWVMSLGSVIKHLTLLGNNNSVPAATAFDWATHGLRIKVGMVDVSDLYIARFQGCGIFARGTSNTVGPPEYEGGTNHLMVKNVTIQQVAGHGLYIDGQDSSAGHFIFINAIQNNGWGVWDNSFLGNTHIGHHCNGNVLGDYRATDPNAANIFLGCYQETGRGSHLLTPTVHVGGFSTIGVHGTASSISNTLGPKVVKIKNASGIGKITITNAGSGYTSAPSVTFAAPSGAVTATATATIIGQHQFAGGIGAITLTNAGSGYSAVPNAVITGDGAGATLRVRLTGSGTIGSVFVIDESYTNRVGHDYTTASVTIDPPTQTTATGTAYLTVAGTLSHIHVTDRGAGYTAAPNITITGGGGSGAAATCVLATQGGDGDDTSVAINRLDNVDDGMRILEVNRDDNASGFPFAWEYDAWSGDHYWVQSNAVKALYVTGPQTTWNFGRKGTAPHALLAIDGIWLGSGYTNNDYRNVSYKTSIPTTGQYAKGDLVLNSNISELGSVSSKYILLGWSRLTQGSGHVLNTDWLEARCLTGN
jgi:hypothetical protein